MFQFWTHHRNLLCHALQWQVSKNELPDAKDAFVYTRVKNKICTKVFRLKIICQKSINCTALIFTSKYRITRQICYIMYISHINSLKNLLQRSLKTDKQATWRKHFLFPLTPAKNSIFTFTINKLRILTQNTMGQVIVVGAKMFLPTPWRRQGSSTAPLIPNHSNRQRSVEIFTPPSHYRPHSRYDQFGEDFLASVEKPNTTVRLSWR